MLTWASGQRGRGKQSCVASHYHLLPNMAGAEELTSVAADFERDIGKPVEFSMFPYSQPTDGREAVVHWWTFRKPNQSLRRLACRFWATPKLSRCFGAWFGHSTQGKPNLAETSYEQPRRKTCCASCTIGACWRMCHRYHCRRHNATHATNAFQD